MAPMVETTAYQPDPTVGTGEEFDAGMMTAGVTYARSFTDKFSAGVTGNFIHEGLADLSQDLQTLVDQPFAFRCRATDGGVMVSSVRPSPSSAKVTGHSMS